MTDTSIEWCHRPGTRAKTWNPTDGCECLSPGCANCYAMRMAGRFSAPGRPYHGLVTIAKNKRAIWNGEGRFNADRLALPLSWRSPCTVFVNSMSDLFYEAFTNEQIAAVFGVMAAAPQHTFQVLTKRARRMREWFEWTQQTPPSCHTYGAARGVRWYAWDRGLEECSPAYSASAPPSWSWPLPNVHLGISVENQAAYLDRIRDLHATPASVHFISAEPLLGPLDMSADAINPAWIDWVIAGCESGPGARDCDVSALLSLIEQCDEAGVACFVKQWRRVPGVVEVGEGSHVKPGGIIGAPYVRGRDGKLRQRLAFPEVRCG